MSRTYVSPGVYTYETELRATYQNLGVTSAAVIGETLKGAAFQPIKVSNYNEFVTRFGGQNPTLMQAVDPTYKYPKYELPYIAKQFLSNANSLYVTRVLGLSGYDAGNAFLLTVNGITVAVLRSKGYYEDGISFDNIGDDDDEPQIQNFRVNKYGVNFRVSQISISDNMDRRLAEPIQDEHTSSGSISLFDTFNLYITLENEEQVVYNVSLDSSKPNYIKRVLGTTMTETNAPVYVEIVYDNQIKALEQSNGGVGVITRSANPDVYISSSISSNYSNYFSAYKPSITPWFIQIHGETSIDRLFRFVTISDGNNSSTEVKFSLVNVNPQTQTFDVLVRAFNDKDENPVVLERFTKCSLDEGTKDYIGRKIGTVDGKYAVRSKYIVVELNESVVLKGKTPQGFLGYPTIQSSNLISNPYYGAPALEYKAYYEANDNIRKTYLGISSKIEFPTDLLKYIGEDQDNFVYTSAFYLIENPDPSYQGVFRESFNGSIYEGDTEVRFFGGILPSRIEDRKFTVMAYGGFDGWDIYRTYRTNENQHAINFFYNENGLDFQTLNSQGFDTMMLTNEREGLNSDYYAYLEGVRTFANPEETNVNVIAVAGLDYARNSALLNEIVEIVEEERADSIFIMGAPNVETEFQAVQLLEDSGIESSYTATYFPWKQYNDTENGVYINIPVTMDVLSNIALVDKKRVPWYAVAGLDRGDVKCVKLLKNLTQSMRDSLYVGKINPVQKWANQGTKIWGNRTLHPDTDAALSSLNVRRLILEARKLIAAASLKLVFDQNDMQVRNQFTSLVNPILENMRKERGLTEFRVEVDNSVESIQRKELRARILIKPTPALEFIIIEFGVTDQGVSFDDV